MTNLQLVQQPEKPERCAAENLKPGQFLAAGALTTGRPTEVLFVDTYPVDHGRETLIVHRALGVDWPTSSTIPGNRWFTLATERELAEFRAGAERAQKIADIRAFADWLEGNPDVAMPYGLGGQQDVNSMTGQCTAEDVATVHAFAAKFGAPVVEVDSQTRAEHKVGYVRYTLIAWHENGRPIEPKLGTTCEELEGAEHYEVRGWKGDGPGTCGIECACGTTYDGFDSLAEAKQQLSWHIADPTGLAYSRADDEPDDPAPVSGHRVAPHTGGLTEGGLVDETPVGPTHHNTGGEFTACGLIALRIPPGHVLNSVREHVTCPNCVTEIRR